MASENSVMAVIRASRPAFRNHHDRVAFAVHASVLSAGFSLIAVGRRALDSDPPIEGEEIGVEGWNELDDAYGFVYSKSEKDKKKVILVKCLPLEDYLMVDAVDLKSDQNEPFHMQINIKDYLAGSGAQQTTYGEMYKNLQGLVNSVNTCILEQVESKGKDTVSARSSRSASIDRSAEGTNKGTTIGLPPHNEPMPSGLVYPPIAPYGGDDLYPGPGAGFFPERGSGMGGGMLVGPNDPRFFGPGAQPGNIGGIPGVPPGARFDPYGPPDVPGFEPQRFVRQPRRPGGGTHPDLEHFHGSDFI
ncbi:probable proteasome inhibitor isoform X1 [Phalaenopsis equestris]|uniref:probable proteasome inhibitor isoform X1 n=1 Tax=Phalaenopsis equestris TaxID=78828 RepID=UPI0009E54F70|nr:probable proteasome inhibitor isoform X1 [Phalaenopsis equestris]